MTVFRRLAAGVSSFSQSLTKLNGLLSARQCSLPDNMGVLHGNKCFVRGFSAVPNQDAVEVDISRLEGEDQGRCIVFLITSARHSLWRHFKVYLNNRETLINT